VSEAGSTARKPLRLFEAFGVELEYMIVDDRTFDVKPLCDRLMTAACGTPESEIERAGGISWSNELVNHVIEFKTTEPIRDIRSARFVESVREANALLKPLGACLMGTAMHPWMNPERETMLWPHEYSEVYQNFDRLFNCKRHGWANLQSMHLNLPFHGDEEFARLHAAVRLVLPLLPALCASSPLADGRVTGMVDTRLDVYRSNQAKTPSLTGRVIPETVFSEDEYQRVIMQPIARDVAKLDPSGIMQAQWMNSRGAIARFDRGSIEIRVMDVQEHPECDLAIAAGVVDVLKWLCNHGPSDARTQRSIGVEPLRSVLDQCILHGDTASVSDREYLRSLGHERGGPISARELWRHMLTHATPGFLADPAHARLRSMVERGPVAKTMLRLMDTRSASPTRERLQRLSESLANCLSSAGRPLGEPA
jgi:glutamate---cysteine ligase / carboxylate-amine ligase